MASPPFNIAETVPGDSDIASQFPGTERIFRDVVESWLLTEHDVNGRHKQVGLADRQASVPAGEPNIYTIWQDAGILKGRFGDDVDGIKRIATMPDDTAGIPNDTLADMAEGTIKGRAKFADDGTTPNGAGDPQDLTPAQAALNIGNFTADTGVVVGTKGAVPAPGIGDAGAGKVLGAGGGWVNAGYPAVVLWDQKAQNTDGGTATNGAWRDRVLNTEYYDLGGLCALAANVFTLQVGTYVVKWSAPGFNLGSYQTRLFNNTDSTVEQFGTSEAVGSGSNIQMRSFGLAKVTIAGAKGFKIQYQSQDTQATTGLGVAANFSTEIYTIVEIWKLG